MRVMVYIGIDYGSRTELEQSSNDNKLVVFFINSPSSECHTYFTSKPLLADKKET